MNIQNKSNVKYGLFTINGKYVIVKHLAAFEKETEALQKLTELTIGKISENDLKNDLQKK